ncbi:MAG: hypothetical protein KAI67_05925 [Candidatus Pacebacteria bacterium]|nr:hypothetical protein [Candidatus Paceibacterota bacterium]
MNVVEEKWKKDQYTYFENEWKFKWNKYFNNETDFKDSILKLEYDKFYNVNNAFGKLDKALQICNFLNELAEQKPLQDTEKIIITTLVSCAEAVYRINKPEESIGENLVKGFFKPVVLQLENKIKGYVGEMPYKKSFKPDEILYLIRNDYIHNGNFIGTFFKKTNSENYVSMCGDFFYSEKEDKTKLISVKSECRLTYQEFLTIFLNAFIKNIKKYIKK